MRISDWSSDVCSSDLDPARRLDAVDLRHANVHQDDIGLGGSHDPHRLAAVGRLADGGQVGFVVDDHPEPATDDSLVVDHDDAQSAHGPATGLAAGNTPSTRQPPRLPPPAATGTPSTKRRTTAGGRSWS